MCSVFHELHEYWHLETILDLKRKQRIVDEEMISIVEDLASEIVYPEKGLHWKSTLLTRVSRFRKEFLQ